MIANAAGAGVIGKAGGSDTGERDNTGGGDGV